MSLVAVLVTAPALAGGGTDVDVTDDAKVARLEALLEAHAAQIEELRTELAAAHAQDQDATRAQAMKDMIREVLSEQEFRESLMPSMMQAGYDKGFFIKSSDENFMMKFNALMQFRWTHYNVQKRNRYTQPRLHKNDSTGFDIQRLRFKFSGHVFTPDLTYVLHFRAESGQAYDARVRDAYINYRFCDEFQVKAGFFKIAALQQRLTPSSQFQFVDRSMVHAVFDLNWGVGMRFWGKLFDKRLDWYLDVMNSFNGAGNRTITNDPQELDGNPGIAFRLVWHALGDNPGKDLRSEADLEMHESPALDFAFHYAFNEDQGDAATTEIPFVIPRRLAGQGGFGLTTTTGMQIHQWGFASAFKYMGFSARGEYILRMLDPRRAGRRPFTPFWLLTRQADRVIMQGAYAQVGYFLPIPGFEKKIEAVGRVGAVTAAGQNSECTWEYAAGVNYYIQGNNVKLQFDVTKIDQVPISSATSSMANVNDKPLIFRMQLQVAF
jgi:hypothetical protein